MSDSLQSTGDYLQKTMVSCQIPGMALSIIRGDALLYSADYGNRNVETSAPNSMVLVEQFGAVFKAPPVP